jgi:hypothetical protein
VPQYEEHDHEPAPRLGKWRPPGRWPALLRLSWLCRLLAILSLVVGVILALAGTIEMWRTHRNWDPLVVLFFYGICPIVAAVIAYIFWTGMAELLLLAVALERNTRQTRDRLPRHTPEAYARGQELTRG